MASEQPFVLRWGIISTGWIASVFVKDILLDPKTRDVHDVAHKISSVGSRSVESAQAFVEKFASGDKNIKAFGSYAEVYADPDVDAVYVGTPHTFHYENARDALLGGKHVLCEKATTSNAAELKDLLRIAKERNLFFMEAMWTRFQPIAKEIKKVAEEGSLGEPVVMHADLAGDFKLESIPNTHRILDPKLGGGALLDLGPYPMIWAVLALYEHPSNKKSYPTNISGSMLKTLSTGVDQSTSFTLTFTENLRAQAILSCSINLPSNSPGVAIRYRNGNIHIPPPIYKPGSFTVQYFDQPGSGTVVREEKKAFSFAGGGWHFEADEVARCVRDDKIESEIWSHDKSILLMQVFDEVRRQGDYNLPEGVEKVF